MKFATTLLLLSALAISTSLACDLKGDIKGLLYFNDDWINTDDKWYQIGYYIETWIIDVTAYQCVQTWWKEGEDWDTEVFTYQFDNYTPWNVTFDYKIHTDSDWTSEHFNITWVYADRDNDIYGFVETWDNLDYHSYRVIAKDWKSPSTEDIQKAMDAGKKAGLCDAQRPV